MSHEATSWAIKQRGLKPYAKIVLWHLADRHNPDFGCFPSQDRLAADAEVSRSALNNQLSELENLGLIRRQRRVDPDTHKQQSTRYILAFEDDFEAAPSPANGHGNMAGKPVDNSPDSPKAVSKSRVQQMDTNPVSKEPVNTTTASAHTRAVDNSDPQAACLDAGGPGLCPASRNEIITTASVIDGWLAEGFDLQEDILPVIRQRTSRMRASPIRTWAYFTDPIRSAHMARLSRAAPSQNAENSMAPAAGRDSAPQAEAPDVLLFWAEWINSDRYLPPSAVKNTMAHALLARGMVTKDRLEKRGFRILRGDAR